MTWSGVHDDGMSGVFMPISDEKMAPPPPMPQPALPPMREVTEDTPPDMLAGAMDLRVLLPDGHSVKMNVDRSTPMMDLLVHVTTANKMSPGSHVIQAVGEKGNILPYKPSTPIGALDTWTIQIVSKSKTSVVSHKKAPLKPSNQPFEQTFRLQVNLPRNQLFVTRVSPRTPLLDVLRHVCAEKALDPDKYDLRNPMNPDEVLRLTSNLLDYKLQEVTVALRGSTVPLNHHSRHRLHATSATDIISLQHQHQHHQQQQLSDVGEKRRKSSASTSTTNNSGGVFGFIFKRGSRSSVCEGSVSSDSLGGHSISPARSDESLGPARSASPPLSQSVPRAVGPTQDQLRNQINSQMSRRQDNSSRSVPVACEKSLKQQMEEGQPPPPPVRHKKRRAPKPPPPNAVTENKKSSEFITPAPPSEPAPIPVARRKSGQIEDDDDEYEEEDIMVGGGHGRNGLNKAKSNTVGGASTGGTIISHSRNSSDSSGYHEASVLSESPESGLGGSGAPDTLPRRKQQQQQQLQRSGASSTSQLPPFSRSMGNLSSNGPPSSASTASSKTMMSSSSYSSLSASTSSLPGQKKKKAPAPPPPTPAPPAKQSVIAEVHERPEVTAKNFSNMPEKSGDGMDKVMNGRKERQFKEGLTNSHCNAVLDQPKSKPKMDKSSNHKVTPVSSMSNSQPSHENHLDPPCTKPVLCSVGSASKPVASVTKSGPAVAPKPHHKVNTSADVPRPLSYNGPDSEDVVPAPMPRSKPPMPKKRTAPRPAPRSKPALVSDTEPKEEENVPQMQKDVDATKKNAMPSGISALSLIPAIDVSSESLTSDVSCGRVLTEGDEDELMGEDIDLELFDGGQKEQLESKGDSSGNCTSEEEEFPIDVIDKVTSAHEARTLANILDSKVDESGTENSITGITLKTGDEMVEGFLFQNDSQNNEDSENNLSQMASSHKLSDNLTSDVRKVNADHADSNERHIISPIRQVESAINFSNVQKEFKDEVDDPNRLSSNSLCSEVDMPFVDGGGSSKMNRWQNMESLVQSSSSCSLEKHLKEMVALGQRAMEEDDSVSANWVVGYESDTEMNKETLDGSEVASNADTADSMTVDSIDEVDCARQQVVDYVLEEPNTIGSPLNGHGPDKDTVYNHVDKQVDRVDISPTLLPSPPPSLEYMGPDGGGKPFETEGRASGVAETQDLDWEYKLPAPPTGFQDEEERRDGAEETPKANDKAQDERETWVAESETASIPSTFSSAASHRKIRTFDMDNLPVQHLPNFRMSTYKASSEDGWEDPREDLNRGKHRRVVDDCFGRPNGRTFVMLNSDNEGKSEKDFREPGKHSFETWASVSSKSSLNKAHYSNLDLSNSSPYSNSSLVMTSFKDTTENGYEPGGITSNGSYVVRVSSFGGKSSTALKRSLSSTSSLVSRHSTNDARDIMEKFDREIGGNVAKNNLCMKNGVENHSLSNSSRTVSLHDLAVNRRQEERRFGEPLNNGYHDEITAPKIVSSKWKKPQGESGGVATKFGAHKFSRLQNLRKTTSELSINQGYTNGWQDIRDEPCEVASARRAHHWQDHLALEGNIHEPLKSLQVLRGVLPQLKKSMSSDLTEKDQQDRDSLERSSESANKADDKELNESKIIKSEEGETESHPVNTKSNSLPKPTHYQSSSDLTHQEMEEELPKRYSYAGPPAINFGTWSERPKSEVSLKRDSDYRIGVGQAPRIKESFAPATVSPPTLSCPSSKHNVHISPPTTNFQQDTGPPCPPPKPATNNRVTVNIVSATKPEPVSRLPIVRSVELKKTAAVNLGSRGEQNTSRPLSCKFPNDLREELTGALASLVDANRNGEVKQAEEVNERRRRQQIPSACAAAPPPPPDVTASMPQAVPPASNVNLRRVSSSTGHEGSALRVNGFMGLEKRQGILPFAPVVKGFRLNSIPSQSSPAQTSPVGQTAPSQPLVISQPPPPPPAVVCGVALKKRVEPSSGAKVTENPRDQLLSAIRDFGGRENLRKTALRYK